MLLKKIYVTWVVIKGVWFKRRVTFGSWALKFTIVTVANKRKRSGVSEFEELVKEVHRKSQKWHHQQSLRRCYRVHLQLWLCEIEDDWWCKPPNAKALSFLPSLDCDCFAYLCFDLSHNLINSGISLVAQNGEWVPQNFVAWFLVWFQLESISLSHSFTTSHVTSMVLSQLKKWREFNRQLCWMD